MQTSIDAKPFYEDVSRMVSSEIGNGLEGFHKELKAISAQKKIKKEFQDEISHQCHTLSKMMRRVSRENIKKFELYSSQNIFIPSVGEDTSDNTDTAGDRTAAESLRLRCAELMAENSRLNTECSKKEQLLADMTSALFQIRVGTQAFDMYDVNPLGDTLDSIREHCLQLENFTSRAGALADDILRDVDTEEDVTALPVPAGGKRQKREEPSVQILHGDDIRKLNATFST